MKTKTLIKYAASLTAGVALLLACEKNNVDELILPGELSVTPTTFNAPATGGASTFTVTSNSTWTAKSNADWAVVNIINSGFVINVNANTTLAQREAVVTVAVSATLQKFITITQSGDATELSVSPSTLTYTVEGGSKEFAVTTSSADWTVSSNATWTTVLPDKASNKVTVTVGAYEGAANRAATITVTAGPRTATVAITQEGSGDIPTGTYVVSKSSYRVATANGATFSGGYQGTYNEDEKPNEVTITDAEGEHNYQISDLFGGFFYPGSGSQYDNTFTSLGTLHFDGANFTLVDGVAVPDGPGPWDTNLLLEESSYNIETHSITLVIPWSTFFVFHLTLIEKDYYTDTEIPETDPLVGTYVVSKESYATTILKGGATLTDEYQGHYTEGKPNEVTITKADGDNNYRISDLFGGFFFPGREKDAADYYYTKELNTSWGIIHLNGTSFTLVEAKPAAEDEPVFLPLEGSYDADNHTITLTNPWGITPGPGAIYTFYLTLIEKDFYSEE
jgi:hypothetical protein